MENLEKDHSNIPPVISAKIIGSYGKVVRTYDSVTTVSDGQRIPVIEPGTFKVEASNTGAGNALQIELNATENSDPKPSDGGGSVADCHFATGVRTASSCQGAGRLVPLEPFLLLGYLLFVL